MSGLLAFFSPYKLAIEIALLGALAAGAMWGVHQFLEHERDIGRAEVQARWDAQTAKDKEAAKLETERLAKQAADAEKNGIARDETIRTLAATAAAASVGMRDTLATVRAGLPHATPDAVRATAVTLGDVFAECESRRRSVAEEAERLNSEKRTLMEAWPK